MNHRFLGFCRGSLRVGERNDPGNRSPEVPKSPKLGGGAIYPTSFNRLILRDFPCAELGVFPQADRRASATRERRPDPDPRAGHSRGLIAPPTSRLDQMLVQEARPRSRQCSHPGSLRATSATTVPPRSMQEIIGTSLFHHRCCPGGIQGAGHTKDQPSTWATVRSRGAEARPQESGEASVPVGQAAGHAPRNSEAGRRSRGRCQPVSAHPRPGARRAIPRCRAGSSICAGSAAAGLPPAACRHQPDRRVSPSGWRLASQRPSSRCRWCGRTQVFKMPCRTSAGTRRGNLTR